MAGEAGVIKELQTIPDPRKEALDRWHRGLFAQTERDFFVFLKKAEPEVVDIGSRVRTISADGKRGVETGKELIAEMKAVLDKEGRAWLVRRHPYEALQRYQLVEVAEANVRGQTTAEGKTAKSTCIKVKIFGQEKLETVKPTKFIEHNSDYFGILSLDSDGVARLEAGLAGKAVDLVTAEDSRGRVSGAGQVLGTGSAQEITLRREKNLPDREAVIKALWEIREQLKLLDKQAGVNDPGLLLAELLGLEKEQGYALVVKPQTQVDIANALAGGSVVWGVKEERKGPRDQIVGQPLLLEIKQVDNEKKMPQFDFLLALSDEDKILTIGV